jgi:tetratricopeptide (TPR) repeat protein
MELKQRKQRSQVAVLALGVWLGVGVAAAMAQGALPSPSPMPTLDPVSASLVTVSSKLSVFATQDARAAITPIADKAAGDARVAVALGRVLEQEKKYDDAIVQLKKATDLAPNDAQNLVYLGEIYLRQRREADIAATFQRIADLMQPKVDADATVWEPRYYLAVAQMRLKQLDKAADGFTKALVMRPDHAMSYYYFGYCRVMQQKWADAVDMFSKALEKDPSLAYAYYYRGLSQDKLGKKDQLVIDMDRFYKLAPNTPEAERAKSILDAAKR